MSWWVLMLMAMCFAPLWAGRYRRRRDRFGPSTRERMDALEGELDERIEDIRRLETRLAELEARTDFAERLLAERSPSSYPAPALPREP